MAMRLSSGGLWIACTERTDRYVCGSEALRFALGAGFSRAHASQVSLAAAELASNAVRHAGGGVIEVSMRREPRAMLELVCRDRGPGIADVGASLRDGHSRGRDLEPDDVRRDGLGTGLGAVARAMDELTIESDATGTVITALKWLPTGR